MIERIETERKEEWIERKEEWIEKYVLVD